MNCLYIQQLKKKKSIQCIMDEKFKQEKNEKNTLASIFVFSASCLGNGIKIFGLGVIQMLENQDFTSSLFLRLA